MIRREIEDKRYPFPFVVYTPDAVKSGLPLIIQLHGAGERGEGGEELSLVDKNGFSSMISRGEFNAIFVMPQCPKDSFWAARVESIGAFIRAIVEDFAVDVSRVYLCGISMGAFGTWYTAMAYPRLFAAIAPCCGGGMPWNAGVLTMPVYAVHGVEDDVVKVSNTDDMVEALEKLGREVVYKRIPGVYHDSWNHTFDEELYGWLLSKKL